MTPALFRSRLAALGLTLHRFCVLAGVHQSTVTSWGKTRRNGKGGVTVPPFPGWVSALLAAWERAGVPATTNEGK